MDKKTDDDYDHDHDSCQKGTAANCHFHASLGAPLAHEGLLRKWKLKAKNVWIGFGFGIAIAVSIGLASPK
jgi:hypothetical protein